VSQEKELKVWSVGLANVVFDLALVVAELLFFFLQTLSLSVSKGRNIKIEGMKRQRKDTTKVLGFHRSLS